MSANAKLLSKVLKLIKHCPVTVTRDKYIYIDCDNTTSQIKVWVTPIPKPGLISLMDWVNIPPVPEHASDGLTHTARNTSISDADRKCLRTALDYICGNLTVLGFFIKGNTIKLLVDTTGHLVDNVSVTLTIT